MVRIKPIERETAESLISKHATADDIRKTVKDDALRGEFIILSAGEQTYLQTAGDAESFTLEYRDGSEAEHYECTQEISLAELEGALLSYLAGEANWKSRFLWKKLETKPWWKIW